MRNKARTMAGFVDIFLALIMTFTWYMDSSLPSSFSVVAGEEIILPYPVELAEAGAEAVAVQSNLIPGTNYQAKLRLLGVVPIKQVEIRVVDRKLVRVSGAPFGIKMFTDGLLVVGMSDVAGEGRRYNPAREAGVKIGDLLEQVNGVRLRSNEQFGALIEQCGGNDITLTVRRGTERLVIPVPPTRSVGDGKYRLGIWVRDSSAGIGTMTYFDPNSGIFTGLGHAVCDVDTGELMPLQSGEIVVAEITGCKIGQAGAPGELKGRFANNGTLGELCGNTPAGVYGYLRGSIYLGEEVPLALASEVKTGPAVIFTTVEGTVPKQYAIEIEKLETHPTGKGQNMVVRITDPALLAKTGGIVQGMSGSPILQNGMLVGSVTHVFVNDPLRGFAIYAENIDSTYKSVSKTQKAAS